MNKGTRTVEHLIQQFEASWNMLRQSIENVPDEKWAVGIELIDKPWSETKGMNVWYFSDRVFHVIQTVEFYTDDDPREMKWGIRIGGIDWKTESPETTASRITKEDMLEYLKETEAKLVMKLRSFSDEDLFEKDGFKVHQSSRLAKFIYTVRHSMWHIGELSKALREWDAERVVWQ